MGSVMRQLGRRHLHQDTSDTAKETIGCHVVVTTAMYSVWRFLQYWISIKSKNRERPNLNWNLKSETQELFQESGTQELTIPDWPDTSFPWWTITIFKCLCFTCFCTKRNKTHLLATPIMHSGRQCRKQMIALIEVALTDSTVNGKSKWIP